MPEIVLLDVGEYEVDGEKGLESCQFAVLNEALPADPEEKMLVAIQEMAQVLQEILCMKRVISVGTGLIVFANFGGVVCSIPHLPAAKVGPGVRDMLHEMLKAPHDSVMVADFKKRGDANVVSFKEHDGPTAMRTIRALFVRA